MENRENEIIELAEYQPDEVEEYEETTEEKSGMSTGLAMLIGSGLTVAGIAAWKFAKKKYDQFKARKALAQNGPEVLNEVEGQDYDIDEIKDVEVDDENTK